MSVREMPNGTFTVQFRCKDADGKDVHEFRRGFTSKEEAEVWESDYKATRGKSMAMQFSDFLLIYEDDMGSRLRETTWATKKHMIQTKIKPFFRKHANGRYSKHRYRPLAEQAYGHAQIKRQVLFANLPSINQ